MKIKNAIRSLRSGRAPGNDGFSVDFYQKFVDALAPRLLVVYQDAFHRGRLPESMRQAVITLLHKKGRDPQHCANYRPISLINVDEKILAKILATRLEGVVPFLIHQDQVGFIRGRSSADNLRRLLHIMWMTRNCDTPTVAFSLDAEKAFDKVEFPFLFYTLEKFGFGPIFRKWVELMYSDPSATVLTNGIMSPQIRLNRGVRQGSPLSPLIFALFLEPLAIALRTNLVIQGVQAEQEEHKLLLYADDVLLISGNPESSVPEICSVINLFSEISGYTVNWSKSEAMPLSKSCPPDIRKNWKFRWMPEGLTYLGIKLTPGLEKIMEANISPVIQKTQILLENWDKLCISLLGRINLVKMILTPKINYITSMLPLKFPSSLLKTYNSIIEKFIWAGKNPMFNRAKLYAAKDKGGLALSRIDWYHLSFSLSQLSKIHLPPIRTPLWVRIEEQLVHPFSVEAFLSQTDRTVPSQDPIMAFAREAWKIAHQITKNDPYLSNRSSIWYNKKLLIDKKSFFWDKWIRSGIHILEDVSGGVGFKSFDEIKTKYNLCNSEFWRYLQIRHCVLSNKHIQHNQTEIQVISHETEEKKKKSF